MRICFILILALLVPLIRSQADPITFPQGYIPFSFLDYQTRRDANGYALVVGEVTTPADQMELRAYLNSLPALSGDQVYANGPIELAPGIFFNNVLVPTSAERQGDFQDFGEPVYDPMTASIGNFPGPGGIYYVPFPGSYIPRSRIPEVFAFRVIPDGPDIAESNWRCPGCILPSPGLPDPAPLGSASFAPEPGGLWPMILGVALLTFCRKKIYYRQ